MKNYTCPKPSCHAQRLLKESSQENYVCMVCNTDYIISPEGKPELKYPLVKEKKAKYGNNRVQVDGIWFDSQGEADYYSQLKMLRKANDIKWFALQPRFILQDGDNKIEYRADFIVEEKNGNTRVIDFKGFETPEFKLKRKMLESQYDLRLELMRA